MTIVGIHGTSFSAGLEIQKTGTFQCSPGRMGKAAYFWDHVPGWIAESLAISWIRYRYSSERKGTILECDINVEESDIVNIDETVVKMAVFQIANKLKLNTGLEEDITKVYDLYITEVEKDQNAPIKLVVGSVAPPKNTTINGVKYDMKMMGAPIALAVREAACISIRRVEVKSI